MTIRALLATSAAAALLSSPASARTLAVASVAGSEPALSTLLVDVLTEEAATSGVTPVLADLSSMATCEAGPDVCMGLAATASGAEGLLLGEVRGAGEAYRLVLTRFITAARTVEQRAETLQMGADALARCLRSRVRRFLTGKVRAGRAGGLLVTAHPPGATVYLDGERVGPAPRVIDGLYAGPHLLEVRRRRHEPASRTVMVSLDTLGEVVVALKPGMDGIPRPGTGALVAAGGAVGLTLVGAAFGAAVASAQQEFDGLGEPAVGTVDRMVQVRDSGMARATTANVLFGAAGASLLAGGWLYWQDVKRAMAPEEAAAGPRDASGPGDGVAP